MSIRMTGASVPLKFADGTEYNLSPLTDKDISELDEWVRCRFVELYLKTVPAGASDDARERAHTNAVLKAATLTWMSGTGASMITTVDGMTRLTWQSVKRLHPQVTEEDLRSHMFTSENLAAVRRAFKTANPSDPTQPVKRRDKKFRSRRSIER